MKTIRRAAVVTVAAASTLVPAASPADAAQTSVVHGRFQQTATGDDLRYDLDGHAVMMTGRRGTHVGIVARGLDPSKTYSSHLHDGTCVSGGGGHYQDVEGGATTPPNELWITNGAAGLVPHRSGIVVGGGSATWTARLHSTTASNALSVVIHEPGGARIACADLD